MFFFVVVVDMTNIVLCSGQYNTESAAVPKGSGEGHRNIRAEGPLAKDEGKQLINQSMIEQIISQLINLSIDQSFNHWINY